MLEACRGGRLFECPQPAVHGLGGLSIRRNPAHAGGDAGEDFPGNCAGGLAWSKAVMVSLPCGPGL